ncbi:neural/ectodermal development factor IMP-L2-like isoform X1 [Cydia strobilella]|uniref:neural/ectodermal development factor IMP-L2-like isoform X1 n=1 Tax=Cydia strobilella TaxID=1100964 RepID=UPI0030048759
MLNLVSLLVAAALVSLQCRFEANAQLDNKQMDNNIKAFVAPLTKRRSRNFVSIQQAPPETARLAGAPIELRCEIMGVPSPTVQWLKNGEPVADYMDETNEIQAVYPSSMAWLMSTLVVSAAVSGDVFTCVATTGLATETASTTVFAEPGDDANLLPLFPAAPVISSYYVQLFQDIGSDVVLPCRVYSPTEPQVYWQDQHHNVIYDNPRMRVLRSGDLYIKDIRWTDMGEYTCNAKNLYGKTTVSSFLYPARPKH